MRLLALLPLSLLALAVDAASDVPQAPLQSAPAPLSVTIVDALGNDPDYELLVKLLRRAKLIPTLNKLNGSTFFAPTNDAIRQHNSLNLLAHDPIHDDDSLADNIQEKLRQDLFYHLLNYTIVLPVEQDIQVLKTLHYPHKPTQPPTHQPPPGPPWMPVPGGTLGGEPQRLRLVSRDGEVHVGVDAFGNGGSKVIKGLNVTSNGVLVGIDKVLAVPPDLASVVAGTPSISYFQRILTPELARLLNSSSELTLFLPEDSAWDALPPIERLYLESEFASDDLTRIFNMHTVALDSVKWSESFEPAVNLTTVDGQTLEIVTTPGKVLVSDAELKQPDIYAANGVLHTVSSLLVPPGSLKITPEKYLLTLNCTRFISMIHSVNLTRLINDTDATYTILAPQDDAISLFGEDELPEKGTEELMKLLKYHFLPGKWKADKLKDGMLVETTLDEAGLDGKNQVLPVEVGDHHKDKDVPASIRFGDASVVGDPVRVENTDVLIYFISRPLVPPTDVMAVSLPDLDLSSFLAAIFSASLADILKTAPRTTLLIPHNEAFKRLGMLVSDHLLSASSKADLENVILHHTIDDVVYASAFTNRTARTYATLEGSDLHVKRTENGTLVINASGGWDGLSSELYLKNTLSRTGVVHELSDVLIPRSVDLTVGKLVKAAKGTTMASLISKAGMEWILNGTAPPDDSKWSKEYGLQGTGWTLLCPTDDAFKHINLTRLYADQGALEAIVGQHLIKSEKRPDLVETPPNNNRPLSLANSVSYPTLYSTLADTSYGDIIFRTIDLSSGPGSSSGNSRSSESPSTPSNLVVGIKDARGTDGSADWAKVTSWGRSTTGPGSGSGGVIQIDRLLLPYHPPWWIEFGPPVVVGVLGLLGICAFWWAVGRVWRRDAVEATYEPVGGFEADGEEDV